MQRTETTLTKAQIRGLLRVKAGLPWCMRSRAGGATARMFVRLQQLGFVSFPPYKITKAGKEALKNV